MENTDPHAKYIKSIEEWKKVLTYEISSCFVFKSPEGNILIDGFVIYIPWNEPILFKNIHWENETIFVCQQIKRITPEDIDKRIEEAQQGKFRIEERTFNLRFSTQKKINTHFYPIAPPSRPGEQLGFLRLPTFMAYGDPKFETISYLPEILDWEVRGGKKPYLTFDELLNEVYLPTLQNLPRLSAIEIRALSPARIMEDSSLLSGKISINLKMAKELNPEKLRIGLVIFNGKGFERKSLDIPLEIKEESDFKFAKISIKEKDATWVQVYLNYSETHLHERFLFDPEKSANFSSAMYELFDKNSTYLKSFLLDINNASGKQDDFEHGVSVLLSLLGFNVTQFSVGGISALKEAPDSIAITPTGKILIVECTIGNLTYKDKLNKLINRKAMITKKLTEIGFVQLKVQPVMVTGLSRSSVTADLEQAGKYGVSVICREELEQTLNRLKNPPNADRLFDEMGRMIPDNSQQNTFQQ